MRVVLDNIAGKSMLNAGQEIVGCSKKVLLSDLIPGNVFTTAEHPVDLFTDSYMITPTVDTYDGSRMCVNVSTGNLIYFDCDKPVLKLHANCSLSNVPEVDDNV